MRAHLPDYGEEAKAIAAKHGGQCLTRIIPTVASRVSWKCRVLEHPPWQTAFSNVRRRTKHPGTWCRLCGNVARRKHTCDEVRRALEQKRIILLSGYVDTKTRISCKCASCKRIWETTFNGIQDGHGCPTCRHRAGAAIRRLSLQYVHELAKSRGIKLLSEYRGNKAELVCHCEVCGHEWTSRFNSLQQGQGCPSCANKRRSKLLRHSDEFVRQFFAERKIELLQEYEDSGTPLASRCLICKYEWKPTYASIQHGSGCPKCKGHAPITAKHYERIAAKYGGRIIKIGSNGQSRSVWQCMFGHRFERSIQSIRFSGGFCSRCSGHARRTREDYERLAAQFKGRVVMTAWNVNSASTWICRYGHRFTRAYDKIASTGRFCPDCDAALAERQCKAALEQLFGVPFQKTKIKNLRGLRGGLLELDLYNSDLKLALEHNGLQHYKPVRFGSQTHAEASAKFAVQREHDRLRRAYCAREGITLIEIRELGSVTKLDDLKGIIRESCVAGGILLPANFDIVDLKIDSVHLSTREEEMWERILRQAKAVGLSAVTKSYLGSQSLHEFICDNGHRISKKPYSLTLRQGCSVCWRQRQGVPISLSDGRTFSSMVRAANALKVSPVAVRYALMNRTLCRGLRITRMSRERSFSRKIAS